MAARAPNTWREPRTRRDASLARPIEFPRRRQPAVVRWATRALFVATLLLAAVAALLSVGPRVLPYHVLPVLTGSMEPTIPTGSIAIVTPVEAADIRVGDIITYHHPLRAGAYVTHRVVAIDDDPSGPRFVTKGDANEQLDPWRVIAEGAGWRYQFAIPELGRVVVLLEAAPLKIALFGIPLFALAGILLFEIWRPRRRQPPAQLPGPRDPIRVRVR